MKKKRLVIPKRLVYVDRDFKTTFVQSKRTGKMMGRKRVPGYGDKTAVLRVKSGEFGGAIMGRTKPIEIRGSNRARAHTRVLR